MNVHAQRRRLLLLGSGRPMEKKLYRVCVHKRQHHMQRQLPAAQVLNGLQLGRL